jgi:hypothetical protein
MNESVQYSENPFRKNNNTNYQRFSKSKTLLWTIAVVTGLVLLVSLNIAPQTSELIVTPNEDLYQAIFLNNGEVYFGKLVQNSNDYLVLEDIYYLRVTPALQQLPDGTQSQQQQQINLVKLGEELHGPEDRMFIPLSSVIYWENITEDGGVSEAIRNAQNMESNPVDNSATNNVSPQQQVAPSALQQSAENTQADNPQPNNGLPQTLPQQ